MGLSAALPARGGDAPLAFDADVRLILQQFCLDCHNSDKHKGDVSLADYADETSVRRDHKLWQVVLEQVNERSMPPQTKPQPTEEQRQRLSQWINQALTSGKTGDRFKNPGRATLRRLNQAQYNNTLRDLLGISSRPADLFPADGGGGAGFNNNGDTLFLPPILLEQYLKAAATALNEAEPDRLQITEPSATLPPRDAARQSIEQFTARAFRRPATSVERDRLLSLFDRAIEHKQGYDAAVKLVYKAALVSPQFLFQTEVEQPSAAPYAVDDFELASRLSYFLWASMPDDELFRSAAERKLHDPAETERQVRRMMRDPKSRALAEEFGAQWLGIDTLKTTAQPDRRRFPNFTLAVRDAMYDEAVDFIDSVFRDDRSVMTLLSSDYTFLNEDLAEHYGIDGVKGQEMRRVTLDKKSRGGVLGLGAVLTVTSFPLRTSPVLRGKWVLETVLGAPPPPPPANAGQLPPDDKQPDGLSFRKRLELHRAKPECASCHNRMDPIGFGLENFDPVGRWRNEQGGQEVDAAGVLNTGEDFSGPVELKKVLLAKRSAFLRNLTQKMLSYALGRGLEYDDQAAVAEIIASLEKQDDKASELLVQIAQSFPFRYRRNDSTVVVAERSAPN